MLHGCSMKTPRKSCLRSRRKLFAFIMIKMCTLSSLMHKLIFASTPASFKSRILSYEHAQMRQWYSDGLENRFPSGYPGSIPGLGVYKKMDLKILKLKFKEHLIRTVGKKSTKKEMNLVDKKIRLIFNKIYNKPDKEEAFIIKAYNEKLSKLWKKVVANETLFQEVLLFYKYTKVKPFFHI